MREGSKDIVAVIAEIINFHGSEMKNNLSEFFHKYRGEIINEDSTIMIESINVEAIKPLIDKDVWIHEGSVQNYWRGHRDSNEPMDNYGSNSYPQPGYYIGKNQVNIPDFSILLVKEE